MRDAAAAAAAALPAWSSMSGPGRGNILYKAADILDRKFDSVAADMTREEGKTFPEAKGEVRRAINILRYFGGEGSRMPGMLVPSERDRVHMFALDVYKRQGLILAYSREKAGRRFRSTANRPRSSFSPGNFEQYHASYLARVDSPGLSITRSQRSPSGTFAGVGIA